MVLHIRQTTRRPYGVIILRCSMPYSFAFAPFIGYRLRRGFVPLWAFKGICHGTDYFVRSNGSPVDSASKKRPYQISWPVSEVRRAAEPARPRTHSQEELTKNLADARKLCGANVSQAPQSSQALLFAIVVCLPSPLPPPIRHGQASPNRRRQRVRSVVAAVVVLLFACSLG